VAKAALAWFSHHIPSGTQVMNVSPCSGVIWPWTAVSLHKSASFAMGDTPMAESLAPIAG
jgi:hypothetical protein